MSGPISRVVFRLCHRPRKRTAKAEFISASTGPLIRRRELPLVEASPTTYSITPSRRFDQGRNVFPFLLNNSIDTARGERWQNRAASSSLGVSTQPPSPLPARKHYARKSSILKMKTGL